MLKQRVITGVILVAIVLSALFASNPIYWRGLITLVIFIGFWEWQRFCRIKNPALKIMSYAAFGAACYAMQMGYLPLVYVLPVICAVWVFLLVFTISDALNALHAPLFKLVLGIIVLSTSGGLLIELKTSCGLFVFWLRLHLPILELILSGGGLAKLNLRLRLALEKRLRVCLVG